MALGGYGITFALDKTFLRGKRNGICNGNLGSERPSFSLWSLDVVG